MNKKSFTFIVIVLTTFISLSTTYKTKYDGVKYMVPTNKIRAFLDTKKGFTVTIEHDNKVYIFKELKTPNEIVTIKK